MKKKHVIIVGGGFAGLNCAHKLINHNEIRITLIDKNNYHEFTPLLYQVAASALSTAAAAIPFRYYFSEKKNIDIKMANVISLNPESMTLATEEGEVYQGDYIVLAVGNVVNFFNTVGAEKNSLPLYNLLDAQRLRSRIIGLFEDADRNQQFIDQGALNFVIVGAGPTGTEVAGALADLLLFSLPNEFKDLAVQKAKIYLINHGQSVLGAFLPESQKYASETLKKRGVELLMGISVDAVTDSYVELSDGKKIFSKTVIWAGGLKAPSFAQYSNLKQGHSGRLTVASDLTVPGFSNIYALGDLAIILDGGNKPLPQLASVAKQAGEWAAKNILAQIQGKRTDPFHYNDKGIMAMIGRNAAVVEVGKKRHEIKGFFAYFTWLSVHIALLPTLFQKLQSFISWISSYFGNRAFQVLDCRDEARVKWDNNKREV